jgi:hypothetical protein
MPEIVVQPVATFPEVGSTVAQPAVAEALDAIRLDSADRPEKYLEDSVVPHGGE